MITGKGRWVKKFGWKETLHYWLLLPFYLIRVPYWWIKWKDIDEFHTWSNLISFAKGSCDLRTGRMYEWIEE